MSDEEVCGETYDHDFPPAEYIDGLAVLVCHAVPVSPKMLLETLCVVEFALQEIERQRPGYNAGGTVDSHLERVRALMAECQRKRPTGVGGKHDDLHTDECGCTPERTR